MGGEAITCIRKVSLMMTNGKEDVAGENVHYRVEMDEMGSRINGNFKKNYFFAD